MSAQSPLGVVIHGAHDLRVEPVGAQALGPAEVEVTIRRGGICGSDLHYFHAGGFGTVRLREPMVLGHEVAGHVSAVGAGVTRVKPGDLVAVNPSRPCDACRYCLAGLQNECLDMRFYGSAMRMPHIQGGFRQRLVCTQAQAVPVAPGLDIGLAAFAEPLAVALHALTRAGSVAGRRVLVTGCGPIGALVILALRQAGAREIVVTDVAAAPLALALQIGADRALDISADPDALKPYEADKGAFAAVFEASGHPAAIAGAIAAAAPRARIVQIGLAGPDVPFPVNTLVAKELELVGTFRFHAEFDWAVDWLGSGRIDARPLLSATLPFTDAAEAFALASDRSRSMKVQLAFD